MKKLEDSKLEVESKKGDKEVTFDCEVERFPPPIITWKKNDDIINGKQMWDYQEKIKISIFWKFFCIRLISLLSFLLFFVIKSFMYLVLGLFPVKILFRKMNIG